MPATQRKPISTGKDSNHVTARKFLCLRPMLSSCLREWNSDWPFL